MSTPGVCEHCDNSGYITITKERTYCFCASGQIAKIFNEEVEKAKLLAREDRVMAYLESLL